MKLIVGKNSSTLICKNIDDISLCYVFENQFFKYISRIAINNNNTVTFALPNIFIFNKC